MEYDNLEAVITLLKKAKSGSSDSLGLLKEAQNILSTTIEFTNEISDCCPGCGGAADNGFDRSYPPVPYLCSACVIRG